jgi:hypothetical protein
VATCAPRLTENLDWLKSKVNPATKRYVQDHGQSGVLLVHAVKVVGEDIVLNFENVREDQNVLVLTNSKKIAINKNV